VDSAKVTEEVLGSHDQFHHMCTACYQQVDTGSKAIPIASEPLTP